MEGSHIFVLVMLALTAISQFRIIPSMDAIRAAWEISDLPDNAIRAQFDSLHSWSVRLEEAVLVCGLLALYLTARRLSSSR